MAAVRRKATKKPAKSQTAARPKAKPAKPKAKTAKPKTKAVKPKARTAKPKAGTRAKAKTKAAPANRRRFDRRDTRITARLDHAGGSIEGTVTNLSLEGCLFAPKLDLKPGSRIKLKLANEAKPVAATVKAVSDLGVHCLLHAGGVTLGRLSADLDDMALLMLSAGRPHDVTPKPGTTKAK